MAITASAVTPDKTLEEFRVEFNKLIQDFEGVSSGNTFDQSIIFEGATADAYETTLLATDPTADRTITLPNVTGTVLTTANSDVGTTTTSSGDADFVLVDDGGVLKKITAANLGITSAADDISTGDAAVSIATSAGNITIDAQAGDTDIIFKGTDNTSDITALTLDMSDAGKAIFNGAISATTITLSADGGVLLPNDGNIGSAGSTAAMQIASTGIVTFVDDILIKDGGTIGVASAATAITVASTGIVTLVDDLILKDAATIGVTSSTSAISIAATGIVTFIDDILLKDAATIGNASVAAVMTLASTGIVTFVDDIILKDAATIGVTSSTSAISIASSGIVTLVDDLILKDAATIGVTSSTSAITIAATGIVTLVDDLLLKDACTIGTATTAGAIAIAADGTVDLATAGATVNSAVIKTAGIETIWVPASAMYPCTSNGCAALTQVETTANQPEMKVLDFDKDSDEFAQFTVAFPKSWNAGTITYRAFWFGLAATTGVAWTLAGRSVADNAESVGAFGTAIAVQDDSQGDVTEVLISATSGTVTIAGVADDTLTFFQVSRDVDDGNDDMAGDARLAGIQIFYTTNAATDA
jgi:hypothetical protein